MHLSLWAGGRLTLEGAATRIASVPEPGPCVAEMGARVPDTGRRCGAGARGSRAPRAGLEPMAELHLGSDVGGTFTDFVVMDRESGAFSVGKTLTTPQNPAVGVTDGAEEVLRRLGASLSDVRQINHCTTLAGNLIVERKGAKVGLVATQGFRDSLEMGRELRYDIFDLLITRAEPLVRRYLRRTVSERMDRDGNVVRPLDLDELDGIVSFFRAEGVQSIAVALLHAYRDATHEQRIRDRLRERYPEFYVSVSSEVAPEVREFERTSTTVANAYVQPPWTATPRTWWCAFRTKGSAGPFTQWCRAAA